MSEKSTLYMKDVFSFDVRMDGPAPTSHDHYHNSFEVYYLQKGSCWYFIDRKSYRLSAGDIALIPTGVIHKTSYDEPISSRTVFNCADSFIPETVRELMMRTPYFSRTDETAAQVDSLFAQIGKEYERPDAYSMDAIRAKVAELFLLIARESLKAHPEKQESPIVEKAVDYIRKHYRETVMLQDVAERCFVSREHLCRVFKRETGFSFTEYLNIYRMQKANAMLTENPKLRVSQVAVSCGFSDSNYFSKQYRKIYGKSPTSERRSED